MRTLYIFNIRSYTKKIMKDSPYLLYKMLEDMYNSNKNNVYNIQKMYDQIVDIFNMDIGKEIIKNNLDDDNYFYTCNHHNYYNRYSDERCEINIKNSYMTCLFNKSVIKLLKNINNENLFACDFENKDYFWLSEIYC